MLFCCALHSLSSGRSAGIQVGQAFHQHREINYENASPAGSQTQTAVCKMAEAEQQKSIKLNRILNRLAGLTATEVFSLPHSSSGSLE